MNTRKSFDFLSIHNPNPAQPATPVTDPNAQPQAPAAPAPQTAQPSIPVAALPAVISAVSAEQAAQAELAAARALQAQVKAAQQPAPQAAPQEPESKDEVLKQLRSIQRQLKESQQREEMARLEAYRQYVITQGRAAGLDPAFDGYVQGASQADIDASLRVALAEQQLAQQRWAAAYQASLAAQQAQVTQQAAPQQIPQPVQAPAAPTGYVTQPAPVQAPVINAPSMVQAPAPVQAQGLTQDDINYMTSSAAIRNGTYAANRQLIMSALSNGGRVAPSPGWTFQPPTQYGGVPQAPQAQPAVQHVPYAGVQMPTVRPQGPLLGPPASYNGAPGMANPTGAPVRAPQPVDLQTAEGAPNGAYFDANAARAAAASAVAAQRPQYTTGAGRQHNMN